MAFNLLINGIYWGYKPLTNLFLTSWDIKVLPGKRTTVTRIYSGWKTRFSIRNGSFLGSTFVDFRGGATHECLPYKVRPLHVGFLGGTVDGRNPAPVDMINIPLFIGFHTSQVVQDFSHQQYFEQFYLAVKLSMEFCPLRSFSFSWPRDVGSSPVGWPNRRNLND